jgi:hypothetical protein
VTLVDSRNWKVKRAKKHATFKVSSETQIALDSDKCEVAKMVPRALVGHILPTDLPPEYTRLSENHIGQLHDLVLRGFIRLEYLHLKWPIFFSTGMV